MPLNALKLIYCKFYIAQIIDIENIDNIIKVALEVFLSVFWLHGSLVENEYMVCNEFSFYITCNLLFVLFFSVMF